MSEREDDRRAHAPAATARLVLPTERLLASIIESSDDAIISKSLDGVIRSWNASAERLFGYTAEEAVGRHISLIIPTDRLDEEDRIIASLKAGQRIDHFETERLRADGGRLLVSLTISPIKNDAGEVIGASKIARDVTRQREAEQRERQLLTEAAETNAKFVAVIENSKDFVGISDLQGRPLFVNHAGLAMVGLDDLEDARRQPFEAFFFPEDHVRIAQEFLPSVLERGYGETEVRFRHFKTGEARWMAFKVITLPDVTGRPFGFATVSQDVTERRRMEDHLRQLATDLSEADRRKNEFLAMLAHELRNPLAPISNAARALRMSGSNREALRSASAMLERQVSQMARLVDDLLDMSRISRGKIELRRERTDLGSIVDQSVAAARPFAASMDHELTVTLPSAPVELEADPTRIAQVIGNLLNNACKFTDRGGHVWLTVGTEGGNAVIRVRDNGIGIDADHLPGIFDMFAQVDTSLERSRDGLGIGLTLVKTVVEMHGGTVRAQSAGLRRGSEFSVFLPLLQDGAAARASPGAAEPARAPGRRILIVDDNEDGAESLALLLQFSGHETHTANDGYEAIEAAARLHPDVMLLDIGLPGLNGYEVCRRIRQEPWGRDVMLIALTGWGQDEDRQRSKDAGFDAHLVKPVNHEALITLLAATPRAATSTD